MIIVASLRIGRLLLQVLLLLVSSSGCGVSLSFATLAHTAPIVVNPVLLASRQVLSTPANLSTPVVVGYFRSVCACHIKSLKRVGQSLVPLQMNALVLCLIKL
jgi:hypothetical protein